MLGTSSMSRLVRWYVRRCTISCGLGSIVHGDVSAGLGSGSVRMVLLGGIGVRRYLVRARIRTSSVVITMAEVAACGLWGVRNHLHSARNDSGWSTTSCGIGRGRRATETLIELLE